MSLKSEHKQDTVKEHKIIKNKFLYTSIRLITYREQHDTWNSASLKFLTIKFLYINGDLLTLYVTTSTESYTVHLRENQQLLELGWIDFMIGWISFLWSENKKCLKLEHSVCNFKIWLYYTCYKYHKYLKEDSEKMCVWEFEMKLRGSTFKNK